MIVLSCWIVEATGGPLGRVLLVLVAPFAAAAAAIGAACLRMRRTGGRRP